MSIEIHKQELGGVVVGEFVSLSDYNEAVDALKNLIAIIDTPIGRRKNNSSFDDEARKMARKVLEKQ